MFSFTGYSDAPLGVGGGGGGGKRLDQAEHAASLERLSPSEREVSSFDSSMISFTTVALCEIRPRVHIWLPAQRRIQSSAEGRARVIFMTGNPCGTIPRWQHRLLIRLPVPKYVALFCIAESCTANTNSCINSIPPSNFAA